MLHLACIQSWNKWILFQIVTCQLKSGFYYRGKKKQASMLEDTEPSPPQGVSPQGIHLRISYNTFLVAFTVKGKLLF